MKSENKPRVAHYKKCKISGPKSLQQLLKETLLLEGSLFSKAVDRQQNINENSEDYFFINHRSEYQEMLFAELLFVEKGKAQSFMRIDTSLDEFEIKPFTVDNIPDDDETADVNKQKEFVDSVLYFGVIENHVVVIQSRSIQAKHLEQHLGWLLGSTVSGALPKDSALILSDVPDEKVHEQLVKTPAKKLLIGSDVGSKTTQHLVPATEQIKTESMTFRVQDKIVSLLKTMTGIDIGDLELSESLDDANLKLKVVLSYDRKTSKCGQLVLDSVAASMRNFDDDDYQIELSNGAILKGGALKISSKLKVETINGSVNRQGLIVEMFKWLKLNAVIDD
ncbi:hypothetical protein [Acinetobacter pittii]|uniref:hypothetical protein n=1 Tax=Acinetobacter pittii TaxID=48296 RepID=UPI000837F64D|nr:hypothetical protein [Acinetobacter pittii]MCU4428525.1 hypothetical protein [Acinetobacter pittii]OCZ47337.1 hypothetical protein BFR73_10400 [Acinetobacter pittii]